MFHVFLVTVRFSLRFAANPLPPPSHTVYTPTHTDTHGHTPIHTVQFAMDVERDERNQRRAIEEANNATAALAAQRAAAAGGRLNKVDQAQLDRQARQARRSKAQNETTTRGGGGGGGGGRVRSGSNVIAAKGTVNNDDGVFEDHVAWKVRCASRCVEVRPPSSRPCSVHDECAR